MGSDVPTSAVRPQAHTDPLVAMHSVGNPGGSDKPGIRLGANVTSPSFARSAFPKTSPVASVDSPGLEETEVIRTAMYQAVTEKRQNCASYKYWPNNVQIPSIKDEDPLVYVPITTQAITFGSYIKRGKTLHDASAKLKCIFNTGKSREVPLIPQHLSLGKTKEFFDNFAATFETDWSKPALEPQTPTNPTQNRICLVRGPEDPGSNFFLSPVEFHGYWFRTHEHAYQMCKLRFCGIPFE